MPKLPIRPQPSIRDARSSVIALPQPGAGDATTPMNFRVSAEFHREFKLFAVRNGMTMVELLHESFRCYRDASESDAKS